MQNSQPQPLINSINYQPEKLTNLKSWKKSCKFTPNSYAGDIPMNERLRFQINSDGFWDPYNTYIVIEVSTADADNNTVQQLDGSAHNFIDELIITSQGKEIERVSKYGMLGNILQDLNYGPNERNEKQHEGIGRQTQTSREDWSEKTSQTGRMLPWVNGSYQPGNQDQVFKCPGFNRPHMDFWHSHLGKAFGTSAYVWYKVNEKNANGAQFDNLNLKAQIEWSQNIQNISCFQLVDRVDKYQLQKQQYSPNLLSNPINFSNGVRQFNNPYFQQSVHEPVFNNEVNIRCVKDGKLDQEQPIKTQTFVVPLLSCIFGVLLPAESYKYIPMKFLKDLCLEFNLNPYAMFTGGYSNEQSTLFGNYNDLDQLYKLSYAQQPTIQQQRMWKFKRFEIWTDIIYFNQEIEQQVMQQYQSEQGLIINTKGYHLAQQYQIQNTAECAGSWSVNVGFESLQGILIAYQLNDYLQYSYCRENYRVSSNVTKLQCKFGCDYVPQLPIEGHAGNQFGMTNKNNVNYLLHLQKTFGKLHDIENSSSINIYNFSVNERPYDITKKGAVLQYNSGTGNIDLDGNYDTCIGLPSIYENQVVGKALYGINLQQLNHNTEQLAGINTTQVRPFEILVETDASNVDPIKDRRRTMYIFCIHDYFIKITDSGVYTYGRG